jgi:predicted transcriptional regulator
MGARVRTIEVDEATADVLEARAAECGVSVAELLADLAASDAASWSMAEEARLAGRGAPGDLAELDRRWAAVQAGEPTVPHEEAVRWLKTWGTPAFRPWAER